MLKEVTLKYISKIKDAFKTRYYIILFCIPYILDISGEFMVSDSMPNEPSLTFELSIFWAVLILIEFGYQFVINTVNNKLKNTINTVLVPSLTVFLYINKIELIIKFINIHTINLKDIHAKYYIPICWLFLIITIQYIHSKRNYLILFINYSIIGMSIIILATTFKNKIKTESLSSTNGKLIKFNKLISKSQKPIILIILDEYESPIEMFKLTKDSSMLELSNYLNRNGWEVQNRQYSQNLLTVNSLSSTFNYNYKKSDSELIFRYSINGLYNSRLYKDLTFTKKIIFYNYGIFDIGNKEALNKFHYYEANNFKKYFLKMIFSKTMIANIINSNDLILNQMINHNRFIVENTSKIISSAKHGQFIYVHLLMPHSPYYYVGKHNFGSKVTMPSISGYKKYYEFTNRTIINEIIKPIKEIKKYRIIISGDHGYRGNPNIISPNYTSTYYFGFQKTAIEKIKTIQDLGSLIYASY